MFLIKAQISIMENNESEKVLMNKSNTNFRKTIKRPINTDRSTTKLKTIQTFTTQPINSNFNNPPIINSNHHSSLITNNNSKYGQTTNKLMEHLNFNTIQYLSSLKRGQLKQNTCYQQNSNKTSLKAYKSSTGTPFRQNATTVAQSFQNSPEKNFNPREEASKNQLQRLKIFNHINQSTTLESIQMIQLIKESVSNSLNIKNNATGIYAANQIGQNHQKFLKKISDEQSKNKKQNYQIGQTRKQIKKIEEWIKHKLNFQKQAEVKGQSIITDRIMYLNMAFGDSARIAGCFSTQVKDLLEYLHNQHHNYYHYLFECLTAQNKKVKSEMELIQARLRDTIFHYEQKQANAKRQQEERSIKVIQNFKKCIQMKEKAQKEVKAYKIMYNQERKKLKVMEQGLLKVVSLFLALGQKSIDQLIFSPDKNTVNLNKSVKNILGKSNKKILTSEEVQIQKRKNIFQQWCGYIIKMIMKMANKKQEKLSQKKFGNNIGNLTFQIIQKYLVDNDSNLSMKEAQLILNNFISMDSDVQKTKKQKLESNQGSETYSLEKVNQHFNNLYKEIQYEIPTIEEVIKKNRMKNYELQVCLQKQTQSVGVQCFVTTDQIGFQINPRVKQRAVCMKQHIEDKLSIQCVFSLNQILTAPLVKKLQKNIRKTINQKLSLNYGKSNSQILSQQTALKCTNFLTAGNLKHNNQIESQQTQFTIDIGVNTDNIPIFSQKKKKTVDFSSIVQQNVQQIINTIKTITINNSQTQNNKTSESEQSQFNQHKVTKSKRERKNGIYINGRNKTHISMKFIALETEQSQSEDQSKDQSVNINTNKQNKFIHKTQKQIGFQNSKNERKSQQATTTKNNKYQTLQERINKNRSFFNLDQIQYSSKVQADINRIKHLAIKAPKKKIARERNIDSHDLHIELAFKNQQKMKFISSVTLWHPRYISQLKKSRNKIFLHPQNIQLSSKNFNIVKSYITHTVDPILREYAKLFSKEQKIDAFMLTDSLAKSTDFGLNCFTNTFPVYKEKNRQNVRAASNQDLFGYTHRLVPLSFIVLNLANSQIKTKSQVTFYFNCLKSNKQVSLKIQVYNSLMEGNCVQLDLFSRALHYFNYNLNNTSSNEEYISYYSLSAYIFDLLEGYCNSSECQKVLKSIVKANKQVNTEPQKSYSTFKTEHKIDLNDSKEKAKVNFYVIIKCIFRYLKQRQQIQLKTYQIINEIISKNSLSTYYEDIKYFLECLPLPNIKKNKILSKCLKYTVYWQKNQPTIPNDILFFIFDDLQLYSGSTTDGISVIKEYLINRCELYFKGTLSKVNKNPDWVLEETYVLFYKIPKLFHRLSHQAKMTKTGNNKKLVLCLLTLIFCNLIDSQMDKRFLPSLLNGLFAIPTQ